GEEADRGLDTARELVFVRGPALQEAHAGDRRQEPGQLGDLGDVTLAKQQRLVRIEAERQVGDGYVEDVGAQGYGIAQRRQRVKVRDEVEALAGEGLLHRDVLGDRAEVVTQVQ